MERVISVFGSSAPKPGSDAYQLAYDVGYLLGKAGCTVATGGYGGVMMGVSQGASDAGGKVLGITCVQIAQFRPEGPNRWVQEEIRFQTLRERLIHLVMQNDGMITLPGGIGTLSEMSLAWSFMQVDEIEPRPFSLLGSMWKETLDTFYDPQYVSQKYMEMVHFADTPETAVQHILTHLKQKETA